MLFDDANFADRADAGRQLARRLLPYKSANPVVLALPRGGVPVAFEVARVLEAPLDLVLVRKIGAPGHLEFGLGAVVDGAHPEIVLNEEAMDQIDVSPRYIEEEAARQLQEIERRRQHYLAGRSPIDVQGRMAIVIDDGIATGGTVRAALKGLARAHPARLVLAVPVAPRDTIARLQDEADEVICLMTPEPFYAVGAHFADFTQTTDEEVIDLLNRARLWTRQETS
ncbi:phosphoribosyltransferase [Microvirga massiliensis]|uniref:phosphoribosyltransferase n=1 Tax=Microvirga massiliensis TaxID=1033741 RepID=UPI00062BCCA2|nr:phosphoribosyltransferase [Microvirga massiliensis]